MQEQVVEPLGEQRFLQGIGLHHRLLHDMLDTGIPLHDLIGLCLGGVEGIVDLDLLNGILHGVVQ